MRANYVRKSIQAHVCRYMESFAGACPEDNVGQTENVRKRRRIQKETQRDPVIPVDFKVFPIAVRLLNDLIERKDNKVKSSGQFDQHESVMLAIFPLVLQIVSVKHDLLQ